jgi:cell division protein FtsL
LSKWKIGFDPNSPNPNSKSEGREKMDKRTMVIEKRNIIVFLCIALTFIFVAILSISYQKSQAQEVKKEVQVQRDEIKQAQGANPNESKQGGKEGPSKEPSSLTEEEQREFEKSAGPGWQGPGVFKTKEEAIKYLKILVKGDEKTIRYFQEAEKGYRKYAYDTHLAIALSAIDTGKSREAFNLAVKVLKTKRNYPEALAEAAQAVKYAHDPIVIPLLREIVKSPNPSVRLQAAGSLLSLGDGDTALPVLDELAEKEGDVEALYYLFNASEKIIDTKGYKILEKALNNHRAEVRISATKLLLKSKKIRKEKAEEIALGILDSLKARTIKDYGYEAIPEWPPTTNTQSDKLFSSDCRACDYTISLLSELKSSKAIPLLVSVRDQNTKWWFVCKRGAKDAIRTIEKKGDKK